MTKPTGRPRGIPTDPPELRVLKGNPQKRAIRAPIDTPRPDGVPPYPPQLRAAGKKNWDLYWANGAVWLANTDIPTLTELCELHDEIAKVRRVLDREGWFQVSENTGRSFVHPLYNTLMGLRNRLMPLWVETHMTPSSRGRANVKPAGRDALDEWETGSG